ncbi:MAG: hypothetical protein GY847_35135 [Proteobacteria bacterium]|nr:hypothetical protein [Pseudomonadota bacterium]
MENQRAFFIDSDVENKALRCYIDKNLLIFAKGSIGRHDEDLAVSYAIANEFCEQIVNLKHNNSPINSNSICVAVNKSLKINSEEKNGNVIFSVIILEKNYWNVFNIGSNLINWGLHLAQVAPNLL